jgi:DNA-binding CsgD family transcriptional regulator
MSDKTLEEVLEETGVAARLEARAQEQDVKKMWKHGMDPAEIARVLDLPSDTVSRYLGAEGVGF